MRITSGSVRVSADIDGTISLSGEGAGARATLNLSAGGLTKEVSFTENGSYQDTLRLVETGDWDSLEGLPVKLQLFLGGETVRLNRRPLRWISVLPQRLQALFISRRKGCQTQVLL